MKAHIAIIGVGVKDFGRAKEFYAEGLGWPILQEQGEWVCFSLGNGSGTIWEVATGATGLPFSE